MFLSRRNRDPVEVAGPLGTPLGVAQRKRPSPRGEAGTSGFLSVSDSDRRVPAELGQDSCMAWRAIPGPLSKRKSRLDSLEAAQGVSGPSSSKNVGVTSSLGTNVSKKVSFDQRLKGWAKGAAQKCVGMYGYP